jgi:cobalt-zinc-cadmium efflux system outer membrane protein
MRLLTAILISLLTLAAAQENARKAYTLTGSVEAVNPASNKVSVTNEPIAGGMGAMTMTYSVDKADVLQRLKPGDRITATMYEGDMTLHDIAIVPAPAGPKGMRLEELERMALAGNPSLAQAQANGRAASAQVRQAGLYPNPTVGYYGDEIRGGYYGGGRQGGFVNQTIITGGKLGAARRVAELSASAARTSLDAQRLSILNNVRLLYYQVLVAQRLVEVRQQLAKLAADATETAHQLANVGQADRPDVLQAEVEQQQVNIGLRGSQQSLKSLWRTLAAVVGRPDLPQVPLEGDLEALPQLTYEECLGNMLRDSPEVKIAAQAIERASAVLAQAKKAPIPDLQLSANLSQNHEPLVESSPRITGVNGGVQLGVQLPIFNRNQGNITAAREDVESASQDLIRVKLKIARDFAGIFQEYESAWDAALQYKTEVLPRAEQAYRLYKANYQNMAAAYPQTLLSQRTLFQLEVDYVQTLGAAWRSVVEIQGFGLMDGLSNPSVR